MSTTTVPTQFAPAELAHPGELERQIKTFQQLPLRYHVLDAVPGIVVILNNHRQIVFANLALNNYVESLKEESPLGKRPGEVLHCVHAVENAGGCGTTEFCSTCGAVRAMLLSQKGNTSIQECLITRNGDLNPLDLSVSATPLTLGEETFIVFAVTDISHEKRRRALERIFFHDVLNTAGGLSLYMMMLERGTPQEQQEFKSAIGIITNKLIDEIKAQRDLAAAESSEIKVFPSAIDSIKFLRNQCEVYRSLSFEENLAIQIDPHAATVTFMSDPTLLGRVLGNMIKNALEASQQDKAITVGCNQQAESIEFWVQNSAFIPRHIQLQMFHRSFSTKSPNRGLGTYSMKLLGEKFLHGKVDFTSSPEEGTIFRLRLPLVFDAEKVAA